MEENDDIVFENTEGDDGEERTPADTIKRLREKLKECGEQRQEYLDGWQRTKADLINARKQEQKEREDATRWAGKRILEDLLDVVDTFEMAFAHKESWERVDKNWRTGVESIYSKLTGILSMHGLEEVAPKEGERFDPAVHQSVEAVPTTNEGSDDTITAVVSKGYALYGKVIRPAKVKVAHFE